ncbi:hypothetical protein J2Z79_000761 [Symbiobacterium terraclitae]|uniref:Uncharacterized protein n=1 Tax=Symbiobacterium terraclitae TaxID=557451 RepID=A0ABS4JPC3_9FIRM|nr:hypothetical protein [Symbiobacterium terraclitae]MBP2017378.1 hypothetical protein [Symbiobacterium terraclitae]
MHPELAALYQEDQRDRMNLPADPQGLQAMAERDRRRRARAAALVAEGALTTAQDYFHAAMLLQHGDGPDDFRRAHELALRAVELGHPEQKRARWLAAASLDLADRPGEAPEVRHAVLQGQPGLAAAALRPGDHGRGAGGVGRAAAGGDPAPGGGGA